MAQSTVHSSRLLAATSRGPRMRESHRTRVVKRSEPLGQRPVSMWDRSGSPTAGPT